jgi:hypothetical protein
MDAFYKTRRMVNCPKWNFRNLLYSGWGCVAVMYSGNW